jgi:hypothetical protein
LKRRKKWKKDEEEHVSSYWLALMKREDTGENEYEKQS